MSIVLDFVSNFVNSDEKMSQKKEVRKMKKFLSLLLVFGMIAGVSTLAHATANPDSLTLTVDVGGTNYSIDIASTTNSFGSVNLGAQKSLYIGSAANDGNVIADWDCAGNNAVGDNTWTLAAAVGANTYGLMIGTSAVGGAEQASWDPGASPQLVSSVTAAQASMPYTDGIVAGQQVGLWVRISMPTTSAGTATHTLTLSIWATAD